MFFEKYSLEDLDDFVKPTDIYVSTDITIEYVYFLVSFILTLREGVVKKGGYMTSGQSWYVLLSVYVAYLSCPPLEAVMKTKTL